ncbi:MAG: hypothetical protein KDB23_25230, partial [Planctomycetales bacterium]|nr:hypothetical protein [Planctomycetales bacterium]
MPVSTPTLPEPTEDVSGDERDLISRRLVQTRWQVKFIDLCTGFATLCSAILAYLLVLSLIDHWLWELTPGQRLAALVALLIGVCWFFVWKMLPAVIYPVNPVYAAHTIEQAAPELKNSLVNLLTLGKQRATMRGMVYDGLRRQAEQRLAKVPTEVLVDRSGLIRVGYAFVALLAVAATYKVLSPKDPFTSIARIAAPWKQIDRPSRVQINELSPGDVEIYRGASIDISARVTGLRGDEQPTIFFSTEDGQFVEQTLDMTADEYNSFRATLTTGPEGIQQSLTYQLRAGDAQSPIYRVTAKAAPSISIRQLRYEYPRYTQIPERTVTQPLDIDAIEGTRIHIEAEANTPIRQAYIELFRSSSAGAAAGAAEKPQVLPMKVNGAQANAIYTLSLEQDRRTPTAASYQ